MEAQGGTQDDFLKFLSNVAKSPHDYGFFSAMRRVECLRPDLPRIGSSRRLKDDALRFSQSPSLGFASSALDELVYDERIDTHILKVFFFGLLGPNGPMPLHLSELLRGRLLNERDSAPLRFFDLINHRFLSLFYRASSASRPVCNLDRPDEDGFATKLAALAGHGTEGLLRGDHLQPNAKLGEVGLLARPIRSSASMEDLLARYFRVPTRIVDFAPRWLDLPPSVQTSLDTVSGTAILGMGAVAGERVLDVQSHFCIELGPLSQSDYERFFPGSTSFEALAGWVRTYLGLGVSCSICVKLQAREVPSARLGKNALLGRNSWLGLRHVTFDADDLKLFLS